MHLIIVPTAPCPPNGGGSPNTPPQALKRWRAYWWRNQLSYLFTDMVDYVISNSIYFIISTWRPRVAQEDSRRPPGGLGGGGWGGGGRGGSPRNGFPYK